MAIHNSKGREIGYVTSGTFIRSKGECVGMAYVRKGNTKQGRVHQINLRGKMVDAVVQKPPFMTPGYYKGA